MKIKLCSLFIAISIAVTNLFAYQATTEEGKIIQNFAENFKKFSVDYRPYIKVEFTNAYNQSDHPLITFNYRQYNSSKDYNYGGRTGYGAYSAKGGETIYHTAGRKPLRVLISNKIVGKPLYGNMLYELFELATLFDNFRAITSNSIAKVFPENITDPKVAKFKKHIADLQFDFIRYSGNKGLVAILQNIEPNGKDGVDVNKNYSEAAITRDQVMAINNLNALLDNFHEVLETLDDVDAFFNYVAAFVDNGGSSNNSAILDNSQHIDLPNYQKYIAYQINEQTQFDVLANMPTELTVINNFEDLQRVLGRFYKQQQTPVYQAVTVAGKSVEQYANNLAKFLTDYTSDYKQVKQTRNSNTFKWAIGRHGDTIDDKIISGSQGVGTYGAIGGNSFVINYKEFVVPMVTNHRGVAIPNLSAIHTVTKTANASVKGIIGKDLYGSKLYELFEMAEILEVVKFELEPVFSNNISKESYKINGIKSAFIDFKYTNKVQGLVNILNQIEPNGIVGVELDKNYSAAAVTAEQVNAINNLNAILDILHKQLPRKKHYDLFFSYVAAFVDHGGDADNNAIIDGSEAVKIPEFQQYTPLPVEDDLIAALVSGNHNTIIKPTELTRIANDDDLQRILGEAYREQDPRTDNFKKLYKQAKRNIQLEQMEQYNLEVNN